LGDGPPRYTPPFSFLRHFSETVVSRTVKGRKDGTMNANTTTIEPTTLSSAPNNHGPGLPRLVLEVRTRLGPEATPEQVTEEVRANGIPEATVEQVRQLWDEGHLPVE
jgi:hypothetical protein